MRDRSKKILSVLAATVMAGAVALTSCGQLSYQGDDLGTVTFTSDKAQSNGGFAVEKDGYVYFINGMENYSAANSYGNVAKGALMRISKAELNAGDYSNVKTIVPQLFVSQNFSSGIYIYGEYVYYATPTTDKDMNGNVQSSWIDFKRAKLDGTEGPMNDYYFRLSNNAAEYRFVEMGEGANKTVYCLYEEDGALKSFNTSTRGEPVTLVKGASDYIYDKNDLTNPTVYYTMSVTKDVETANPTSEKYTQLYKVSADTTVTVDAAAAKYTSSNGTSYDFNETAMKEQNDAGTTSYDFNDYTTYPYVNLGQLVLDGVGKNNAQTIFNQHKDSSTTSGGYTYTVSSYQYGKVYFTRANVVGSTGDSAADKLYSLADTVVDANTWNTAAGNDQLVTALADSTIASGAIFTDNQNVLTAYYIKDGKLFSLSGNTQIEMVDTGMGDYTLWTVQGDYLYFYKDSADGNGYGVSRIKTGGTQVQYGSDFKGETEYSPVTVALVDWAKDWYKPEFFGNTLLYANAQSFGTVSYNYVYAIQLGNRADLDKQVKDVKAVKDAIAKYSDTVLKTLLEYYYQAEETTAYEAVKDEYSDDQQDEFNKFVARFADTATAEDKLVKQSSIIAMVGKLNDTDKDAIAEGWKNTLLSADDDAENGGLEAWAIILIIVGGVLVVGGATVATVLLVKRHKQKKAAQAEAEATVNAYKKKIDVTDDQTIDVYADEKAEETTEESVEETQE